MSGVRRAGETEGLSALLQDLWEVVRGLHCREAIIEDRKERRLITNAPSQSQCLIGQSAASCVISAEGQLGCEEGYNARSRTVGLTFSPTDRLFEQLDTLGVYVSSMGEEASCICEHRTDQHVGLIQVDGQASGVQQRLSMVRIP